LVQERQSIRLSQNSGVEPCIFDAYSNAGSHEREQSGMLLFEVISLWGLNVNYADYLVLSDQGNCQLRSDLGHGLDVFSISGDVVHQNSASFFYSTTSDA